MVYPAIVFMISAAFCLAVARQYARRKRPYQLIWTLSLAGAAIGSLSYVVFLAAGKPELAFRLYYVFGALLTAPLLGLGSLLLISRTEQARARVMPIVYVVLAACVVGAMILLFSPIKQSVLAALNGGPGDNPDVYKPGIWTLFLVVLNSFGGLAVVGAALYSGWQLWRRAGSTRLVSANVLIATGTIIISLAGGMARTGFGVGLFWLTMAAGWIVLFGGFLLTFKLHAAAPAPAVGAAAVART